MKKEKGAEKNEKGAKKERKRTNKGKTEWSREQGACESIEQPIQKQEHVIDNNGARKNEYRRKEQKKMKKKIIESHQGKGSLRRITGKLKKTTLGKNRTLNVERRSMCIIDKKE